MAVLRSGKNTVFKKNEPKVKRNKSTLKQSYKLREFSIKLKRISDTELQKYMQPKATRYHLRHRTADKNSSSKSIIQSNPNNKTVAVVSTSNVIWRDLINGSHVFRPTDIVLAKMGNFRPWPARINSVYKVGNVVKCYVLFYGTLQIGSVLQNHCVRVSECDLYIFHAVDEIKKKYNWRLDFELLSKTDGTERAIALLKLTQVQKFLLALRDIENLRQVPYELSIVRL